MCRRDTVTGASPADNGAGQVNLQFEGVVELHLLCRSPMCSVFRCSTPSFYPESRFSGNSKMSPAPFKPLVRQYNYPTLKWGGAFFACLGLFCLASAFFASEKLVPVLLGGPLLGLGVLLFALAILWREEWEMDEIGITYRRGGCECAHIRLDEIENVWVGNTGLTLVGPPGLPAIHVNLEVHQPFLETLRRVSRSTTPEPGQAFPQRAASARGEELEHHSVCPIARRNGAHLADKEPEFTPVLPLTHDFGPGRIWVLLVAACGLTVFSFFVWLDPTFMDFPKARPRDLSWRDLCKYAGPVFALIAALSGFFFVRQFRVDANGVEIHYLFRARRFRWSELSSVALGRKSLGSTSFQLFLVINPHKGSGETINVGEKSVEFLNTILLVAARAGVNLQHQI
jgi:hypothetical protein